MERRQAIATLWQIGDAGFNCSMLPTVNGDHGQWEVRTELAPLSRDDLRMVMEAAITESAVHVRVDHNRYLIFD
jgi:hypothetical protein